MSNSHVTLSFLFLWNWNDKYVHAFSRKPYPNSNQNRPNRPKRRKNHTFWGGTHLLGKYKGVPSEANSTFCVVNQLTQSSIRKNPFAGKCFLYNDSRMVDENKRINLNKPINSPNIGIVQWRSAKTVTSNIYSWLYFVSVNLISRAKLSFAAKYKLNIMVYFWSGGTLNFFSCSWDFTNLKLS